MDEKKIVFMTRKDIHAGISNFIHNELKISRQDIDDVMRKRVEEVIDSKIKDFLNSKYFEGLVQRCIIAIIKEGIKDNYYGTTSFEKFVTEEILRQVQKMVTDKYVVKVEERIKNEGSIS